MRQNRYIGRAMIALSVTAALLVASCCLGQTQARYENYTQWRGVYMPQQTKLQSDRLASGGQKVLLKDWRVESESSRMKGITIRTVEGTVDGRLSCSVDQPEYLSVSLDRTELTVDSNGVQTQLTMTPTQAALGLTEQVTATIHVSFSIDGAAESALWADYQVKLLPADENMSSEIPQTEETAASPAVLNIISPESFAWTELLAVQITTPALADTLVLEMDGGSFPEGMRYTLNGMTFLLGDDMQIESAVQGGQKQDLLLDFSLLSSQNDTVTLKAQTFHQQIVTAAEEYTVATTREALWIDHSAVDWILSGNSQLEIPLGQDTSELVWRLEMLTETETGVAYTQSDEQFYLVITISENAQAQKVISISNANGKAPAGAYRLTLGRLQEEQIISSTNVQFFVCY